MLLHLLFITSLFSHYSFTPSIFFFFFNDTATTEIYTLSLHDALPIFGTATLGLRPVLIHHRVDFLPLTFDQIGRATSELQSLAYLVCRLLLEKKKTTKKKSSIYSTS